MRRIWLGLAALALLGACETTYPGEPASAHDDERAADSFAFQIDTGRQAIYADRINQALDLMTSSADETTTETPDARRAHELHEAQANIRATWFKFLDARTRACGEKQFVAIACTPLAPPAWLWTERADVTVDAAVLVRRLDELQTAMGPLVDAACEQGKKLSTDENAGMFCSVE